MYIFNQHQCGTQEKSHACQYYTYLIFSWLKYDSFLFVEAEWIKEKRNKIESKPRRSHGLWIMWRIRSLVQIFTSISSCQRNDTHIYMYKEIERRKTIERKKEIGYMYKAGSTWWLFHPQGSIRYSSYQSFSPFLEPPTPKLPCTAIK